MAIKDQKTILVVDDHPMMHRELEKVLKSQGFDYIGVQDSKTGFKIAKEESPSIILMDVKLPDVDGKELVKQLQKDPATENIPVVFITVTLSKKSDKEDKFIEVEGVTYPAFAKPLYYPKLVSVVRKMIKENEQGI